MTIIATVLRSGGEYGPEHVRWLQAQFCKLSSVCFSDVTVPGVNTIRLRFERPGWFSKMELFDPAAIESDILFFDLSGCGKNWPRRRTAGRPPA